MLDEWDTSNSVTPQEITYGSGYKAKWKCKKGHKWVVSVANRVQGTFCPICARTQTSFPEQAIAYYLRRHFRIEQRYSDKGYELDIFLTDYNIGVEYDGIFFHKDKNDRDTKKDDYYKEHDVTLVRLRESTENSINNNVINYVVGKSNYLDDCFNNALESLLALISRLTKVEIKTKVNVIKDELNIRSFYQNYTKEQSLGALNQEISKEWNYEKNKNLTPFDFSSNSHTKVWWKCNKGHEWKAEIASRNSGRSCPYCAGQSLICGVNDLETWCRDNNSDLLSEWDFGKNVIKPNEVFKTSNIDIWWKCDKGHSWKAFLPNRLHGTKCPYCNTGRNSKKYTLREWCELNNQTQLLNEWNYDKNATITPDNTSKGSHKVVWWKCDKGHEWQAQIKSRTYNHGCPYCSKKKKKVQVGTNDLVTWCKQNNKEYIIDEWDYDNNDEIPEECTYGSHRRINWKCKQGHKWSAIIKERTRKNGNMCPLCKKSI